MKRFIILSIILIITVFPCLGETRGTKLYVKAHSFPERPVWVGQEVLFYVTLSMSDRPRGTPLFSVPDIPGGILLHVSGSPVYGKEEIDDVEMTTWTYSFVFYPHRPGNYLIPSITVRIHLPDEDYSSMEVAADTNPFKVESRMPAGTEGLATLITTKELKVKEKWQPDKLEILVGDAISRSITMQAPNILGMGFPQLPFDAVAGVSVYPGKPVIKDESYRGEISGERTDSVTYVFEKEGIITLPGLIIPWFDMNTQELKQVTLPSRNIEVLPNPSFAGTSYPESADHESATSSRDILVKIAMIAAGVFLFFVAALFYKKRLSVWMQKRKTRYQSSEVFLFHKLEKAVKLSNIKEIINCASQWLHKISVPVEARNLTGFANLYGDYKLQGSVKKLMEQAFSKKTAGIYKSDSGEELLEGLKKARIRCFEKEKHKDEGLPLLNPSKQKVII